MTGRIARLTLAAALAAGAAGSSMAQPPPVAWQVPARLEPGLTRTVLERMPEPERAEVLANAAGELQAIGALAALTQDTAAAAARTEEVLRVETARVVSREKPPRSGGGFLAWLLPREASAPTGEAFSPARLREAARRLAWATEKLTASPYIYAPYRPKDSPGAQAGRIAAMVERASYRSTVGLGRPTVGGVELYCSGVLISPTVVLTAAHCLIGPGAPASAKSVVVLTHFTGGVQTVRRAVDGMQVKGVEFHAVADGAAHQNAASIGGQVWGFDVATLQLVTPVNAAPIAGRAKGLPSPIAMTAAGWGLTDAAPANDVALEVTSIQLRGGATVRSVPPTLLEWARSSVEGGSLCRADSGGPIFAGLPDASGKAKLQLVGLVASGDVACSGGDQFITDLTAAATQQFICQSAAGAPYCSK